MIINKLLSFFYKKEDMVIYCRITILGIKITYKPHRLKAKIIQKRLDNLWNKNKEIENDTKKGFYDLYLNNKDKIDYTKLIGNIPYVSIIIPVYNIGRELLVRCLESAVNQTLKNIEIIIVNDCSPLQEDDIICKEYANKDTRIKYIKNETRMGSGGARLNAIKHAAGYTIAFLDSDDYVKDEAYEIALFSMIFYNVDIVVFGFYKIQSKTNEVYIGNFNVYNNIIKYFLNNKAEHFLWNKLYKTSIISNINKKLMPDDLIGEDRVFNFNIFNKSNSLGIIPLLLYYYDRNIERSQALTISSKFIKESFYSYEIIIKAIEYNFKLDFNIPYAISIYNTFYRIFDSYKNIDKSKYYELRNYLKNIIISQLEKYEYILNISLIYDYIKNEYFSYDALLFVKEIYDIYYKKYINNFFSLSIDDNYVLVTEFNDVHGEVIPGIVKYFLDLSYKVDILITAKQFSEGILSIFNGNENVRIFYFDREYLIDIIKTSNLSRYKCIFITSYYLYYTSDNWPSIKDYIKNIEKKNRKLIIMEHHLDLVNEKFLKNGKITVMHNINESKFPVYINPHYFGNIKITGKNKNITKFIVVGWAESHRKNFNLLFDGFNKLLKDGYNNFRIIVIGKGSIYSDIASLLEYIEIKGRLSYPDMYKELENADFFLPMLDNENPHHERYLKYGVSGSFQLIYGFLKPPVIHEKFAYKYGFNNDNSIIYKKNDDFDEALKTAINMNGENYIIKQNNLNKYRNELYNKSLINLKNIIKG